MERTLLVPTKQPDYRLKRSHTSFLLNLGRSPADLKAALRLAWDAFTPLPEVPSQRVASLVRDKYSLDAWNLKF